MDAQRHRSYAASEDGDTAALQAARLDHDHDNHDHDDDDHDGGCTLTHAHAPGLVADTIASASTPPLDRPKITWRDEVEVDKGLTESIPLSLVRMVRWRDDEEPEQGLTDGIPLPMVGKRLRMSYAGHDANGRLTSLYHDQQTTASMAEGGAGGGGARPFTDTSSQYSNHSNTSQHSRSSSTHTAPFGGGSNWDVSSVSSLHSDHSAVSAFSAFSVASRSSQASSQMSSHESSPAVVAASVGPPAGFSGNSEQGRCLLLQRQQQLQSPGSPLLSVPSPSSPQLQDAHVRSQQQQRMTIFRRRNSSGHRRSRSWGGVPSPTSSSSSPSPASAAAAATTAPHSPSLWALQSQQSPQQHSPFSLNGVGGGGGGGGGSACDVFNAGYAASARDMSSSMMSSPFLPPALSSSLTATARMMTIPTIYDDGVEDGSGGGRVGDAMRDGDDDDDDDDRHRKRLKSRE